MEEEDLTNEIEVLYVRIGNFVPMYENDQLFGTIVHCMKNVWHEDHSKGSSKNANLNVQNARQLNSLQ